MKHEIGWPESFQNDLAAFDESAQEKVISKVEAILDSPNTLTERVIAWPGNIRKIRVGDYRLLLYVSDKNLTVYPIVFCHRKQVYKKATEREVLKVVSQLQEELRAN